MIEPAGFVRGMAERLSGDPTSRDERRCAECLRVVAAATRSGSSLAAALEQAAGDGDDRVRGAFRRAAAELGLGVELGIVLDRWASAIDVPAASLFASVLGVHHRRGGDLGALCSRVSRLLHERGRLQAEARSATAQARFAARAVLALPAVIAIGWALFAPTSFAAMCTPRMLLALTPALVLIVAGVLTIRRCALRALALDIDLGLDPARTRTGLLARVAGSGSVEVQTRRMVSAAAVVVVPAVVVTHGSFLVLVCAAAAVTAAACWPHLEQRRQRTDLVQAVELALPSLLELSIALSAAGATPHETVAGAISACPGVLGRELAPAIGQIRLGRSLDSALGAMRAVAAVPELDAWLQAVSAADRFGVPIGDACETLLRDARSIQRERVRARAATMGPRMQLATVLLIVPGIMWIVLVAVSHGLLHQLGASGVTG